jgi:hypothetical protein
MVGRRRFLIVVLVWVASWVLVVGSAGAFQPVSWRVRGQIDAHGLTGLSCPSRSLCVAVDSAGNAVTSTDPTAGRPTWQLTNIDGSNRLSGVSCPSMSLCVAVDTAGNVIPSVDPTAGPAAWLITHVDAPALRAVSCPAVSLCLAIVDDAAFVSSVQQAQRSGNVEVSTDPAGGGSRWSRVQADGFLGPNCGKYGPWEECGNRLTGLSCPSVSRCVAVDTWGFVVSSQTPSDPSVAAWEAGPNGGHDGPQAGSYDGVSCATDSFCVGICPVGVGFSVGCPGTAYHAGSAISWDPATYQPPAPATGTTVSARPLTEIWCESLSLCAASDGQRLFGSTNPGGRKPAWELIDRDAGQVIGFSCRIGPLCLAVNSAGQSLIGGPPPTRAQITTLLAALAAQRGHRVAITRLLRAGYYTVLFRPPVPGRLTISWYSSPSGHSQPRLVARGARSAESSAVRVVIKLTPFANRLLMSSRPGSFIATASFTPTGNGAITAKRRLKLRH